MIKELKKETYEGYPLYFSYQTDEYYDVSVEERNQRFTIELIRKPFEQSIKKGFTSKLFERYLEQPKAYGYFIDEKLVGIIAVNFEQWNKRLRVNELLVEQDYRRQGIGNKLMDYVKAYAKEIGARALILETQTCNTKAIDYYRAQGFKVIGIDTISYTNEDIKSKEVRIELGYIIK